MKYMSVLAVGLIALTPVFADTNIVSSVNAAISKLNTAPNYSWTVNVQIPNAPFTPAPVNGVAEKDGYAVVTQDFNGNTMQAVFKGGQIAIKGEDGWVSIADADDQTAMMGGFLVGPGTPIAEANKILRDAGDLSTDTNGVIGGNFTDAGATDQMTFPSRNGNTPPPPKDAKGSLQFWLNPDDSLARYETHLTAKIAFGPDQDPQDFEVTRTVEIHDVGTTKVNVPADALKVLEAKSEAEK